MIEIDFHTEWYELYDGYDNYIDRIEDYFQWLSVRVQIKEQKLTGYYIKSRTGVFARIDKNGNWETEKLDPYSVITDLLMKLI